MLNRVQLKVKDWEEKSQCEERDTDAGVSDMNREIGESAHPADKAENERSL